MLNPKDFKEWIKSIEQYVVLTRTPIKRTQFVAYQASQGPLSDFLKRYLDANPIHDWGRIKTALRINFGEVIDSQHALLLLRKCKQKPGETVQVYAERLNSYAEDAFEGQQQAVRDQLLVAYFVDGLRDDRLKMKVMRENPNDFARAVIVATQEHNLRKRFQLRTGHPVGSDPDYGRNEDVPMEIDHARTKLQCRYCKKNRTTY